MLRNEKGDEISKNAVEKPRGHTVIVDWPDTHIHLEEDKKKGGRPKVKLLNIEFGKFRHGRKPKSKWIAADFENMTFTEAEAPDLEE